MVLHQARERRVLRLLLRMQAIEDFIPQQNWPMQTYAAALLAYGAMADARANVKTRLHHQTAMKGHNKVARLFLPPNFYFPRPRQ